MFNNKLILIFYKEYNFNEMSSSFIETCNKISLV